MFEICPHPRLGSDEARQVHGDEKYRQVDSSAGRQGAEQTQVRQQQEPGRQRAEHCAQGIGAVQESDPGSDLAVGADRVFCQQRQSRAHRRGGQGQDQERARQVVQGLACSRIGHRFRLATKQGDKQQLGETEQHRDQ